MRSLLQGSFRLMVSITILSTCSNRDLHANYYQSYRWIIINPNHVNYFRTNNNIPCEIWGRNHKTQITCIPWRLSPWVICKFWMGVDECWLFTVYLTLYMWSPPGQLSEILWILLVSSIDVYIFLSICETGISIVSLSLTFLGIGNIRNSLKRFVWIDM